MLPFIETLSLKVWKYGFPSFHIPDSFLVHWPSQMRIEIDIVANMLPALVLFSLHHYGYHFAH